MKKILFALMISSGLLHAQSKDANPNTFKYRFGFKIAPNISWIKSDDKFLKNNGAPVGFSYGITFDKKLSKTFLFTTGFDITNINGKSIIQRAVNFNKPNPVDSLSNQTSLSTAYSNKLRYLEIPLLFSGRTKEIGYLTYFFQAGFTPSFLLKQKADITSTNSNIKIDGRVLLNSTSVDEFTSKQDDISFLRVGFALGAGAEYNLQGTTSVVGSIRFSNGLFNVMKDPNKEFQSVKNNYISLNLGIVFQ